MYKKLRHNIWKAETHNVRPQNKTTVSFIATNCYINYTWTDVVVYWIINSLAEKLGMINWIKIYFYNIVSYIVFIEWIEFSVIVWQTTRYI